MVGVYKIYNKVSGNIYIGSSNNMSSRWQVHRRDLRKEQHHSRHLQAAWLKYGEDAFVFEVIEECTESLRVSREQFYINKLSPKYNMAKIAGLPNPPQNKPIVRIDMLSGEAVIFETRDLAALSGGFNEGEITACCLGRAASHRGYYWRFQDGTTPMFISTRHTQRVLRSNIDGTDVTVFPSLREACDVTPGASYSSVLLCCNNRMNSHGGYMWGFLGDGLDAPIKMDLKSRRPHSKNKAVRRISISDGYEYIYEKVSDVSSDGYSMGNVLSCCNGVRKTHKGCFWGWLGDEVQRNAPSRSKGVIVATSIKTGEQRTYPDTAHVAKDGFRPGKVSLCCLGRRKSHGGYTWSRI